MEILTNSHKCDTMNKSAGGAADSFRVTDLKQALKDKNRINVYIDGEFEFSLDLSQVVDFGLKIGKILTAKEISDLKSASEFGKLYNSTLAWLLSRPHSEKELKTYLKEKQYKRTLENKKRKNNKERLKTDPELRNRQKDLKLRAKSLPEISDENIEKVFNRLKSRGYVDDEKFAKYFVENRNLKKGTSRKKLELELKSKGISSEIIEKVFIENPRDETEEIKKIITKKRKKYTDEKLISYLVRAGFDYQLSQNLVREMDSQNSAQNLL